MTGIIPDELLRQFIRLAILRLYISFHNFYGTICYY
jgi:hypothetical protein